MLLIFAKRCFQLCILTTLLYGCAAPIALPPTDVDSFRVANGSGAMALEIFSNVNPPLVARGQLLIETADGKKQYMATNKSQLGASYGLFIETLPSGRYRLVRLELLDGMTFTAPIGKVYTYFDIQPGKITDLGGIVLKYDSVGVFSGSYKMAHIEAGPEKQAFLRKVSSNSNIFTFAGADAIRLNDNQLNDNSMLHASGASTLELVNSNQKNDTMVFGKSLGFIDVWKGAEFIETIHTSYPFSVRAIWLDDDESILAGLEEGVLLRGNRNGKSWTKIEVPEERATIRLIQKVGSEYILVLEDAKNMSVYASPTLNMPQWTKLGGVDIENGFTPSRRSQINPQLSGRTLLIPLSTVGWTIDVAIHSLNLDTRQWQVVKPDLYSGGAAAFLLLPNGSLATVAGMNINSSVYLSNDLGKTWNKQQSPAWLIGLTAKDNVLFAPRLDHMGAFSAKDSVVSLWSSTDNGSNWGQVGTLPIYMYKLFPLPEPGALLFVDIIGNQYRSLDDGRTWKQF